MNRKSSPFVIAVTLLAMLTLAAVSAPRRADAIEIDPGKWQFTTTSQAPMVPTPRVETDTECIEDGTRSAKDFMQDNKDCTISDVVDTDTVLSYKVTCPNGPMVMKGVSNFKSTGSTMSGIMRMSMSMNGQEMTMDVKWEGKRLGPCDG